MRASGVATLLVALGSSWAAEAQSLGELAQKEKERRAAQAKEAKPPGPAPRVVTQEDLDSYAAERPAESETAGAGTATDQATGTSEGEASSSRSSRAPDESAERARLEKSWKARAESARKTVKAAERELEAAQSDRNGVGTGPPSGGTWRDGEWTQMANAADARLARARSGLEQAKQGLEQFEEEARRAGIPPGWLR